MCHKTLCKVVISIFYILRLHKGSRSVTLTKKGIVARVVQDQRLICRGKFMSTSLELKLAPEIEKSITDFAETTTGKEMKRALDIRRDKIYAVRQFFSLIKKTPDQIAVSDVSDWHQWMLDEGKLQRGERSNGISDGEDAAPAKRGLEESTVYVRLSHLSAYFEWLMKMPAFSSFIKINPARAALPKPPKKYNSSKGKSLTDEDFLALWNHVAKLAEDETNKVAARDYAILTLFAATGMRREEVLGLMANDIKITAEGILIHALFKGGDYKWKIVSDEAAIDALDRYLSIAQRKSVIGRQGRALWVRFDRGAVSARYDEDGIKREQEAPLSSHSFDKQIKKYATQAGIGHFHIHQFRHTFARMIAEEFGIIEAQDALGHADLATTREYVKKIEFKKDKYSSVIARRRDQITFDNSTPKN